MDSNDGQLLRSAVEAEEVGTAIYDSDLAFVFVNPAFQALKPHVSMVGKRYAEVWPELAQDAVPRLAAVLEGGEPWVARDKPFDVERPGGLTEAAYYTFSVKRLDFDGERYLVETAAATTERVESEREAQQKAQDELNAKAQLLRAATALAQPIGLRGVLDVLADVLLKAIGHTRTWVYLWDDERRVATLSASAGEEAPPVGTESPFELLSSETQRIISEKRTHVVDYDVLPPEQRGQAETVGSRLALLVPMLQDDSLIGVVVIDDPHERREFTDRERATTEGIAAQAAVVVQNARLLEESRAARAATEVQTRRLAVLKDLAVVAASSLETSELGARLAVALHDLLGASRTMVLRIDDAGEKLEAIGSHGYSEEEVARFTPSPRESQAWRVYESGVPFYAGDPGLAGEWSVAVAKALGVRSFATVPLVAGQNVVGVTALGWPESRKLDADEVAFIESAAAEIGIGLERARQFEAAQKARLEAKQELEATSLLLGVAHALAESVELPAVLDTVARVLLSLIGHTRTWVFLWREADRTATLSASAGTDALAPGTTFPFDELSAETKTVVAEKRTQVVDYDALPPERRGRAERLGSHISLLVPLVQKGRLVGVVGVDDPGERREFTPREIALAQGLAAQAAVAIEGARLFDASRRELDSTTVLKDVAAAASELDMRAVADKVLETAQRLPGAKAGIVYSLDEEQGILHKVALRGYSSEAEPLFERVPLDDRSVSGRAVLQNRVVTHASSQLPVETRQRAEAVGEIESSWVAIPAHAHGIIVGTVTLVFDAARAFIDEDFGLFAAIGDQLGVAMENARLVESERAELERRALLQDVAAAGASGLEMDDVAARVLEAVDRHLGLQLGDVRRLADDGARAIQIAALGWPEAAKRRVHEIRVEEDSSWMTSRVISEGRLLTQQDEGELTRERQEALRRVGALDSRYIILPLRYRERVLGVMSFTFAGRRPFTREETELLGAVADIVGQTLANGLQYELERERARFGRSMAEINNELASSLDVDETLPRVLERACRELDAYAAGITDRVEGGWRVRVLAGVQGSGYAPGFTFPDEQAPTLMAILRTGKPDITPDVRLSPNADLVVAERAGYRAYVGYPLVVRGQVVGALGVFFHEPRRLAEAETDYVRRAAFAVSLAEENSRLYHAEHRIAETLQTALLALPAHIPGVEFAHLYHSATEAARVGGDFYDLFELEHDRVGITVGDISGHGVDAAVLTSLVKNAIRVQATQQDKRPNDVMKVANKLLYDNSPAEIFATVFFGILGLDDGLLEYCNAGHTTGACVCTEGGVRKLPSDSPLMGAFAEQEFGLSTEHFETHDLLFLYTDGLTEARRDGELFGEERLFELLAAERGGYPEHTLRTVVGKVLSFTEGRLSDDLAVLAVQRAAPSGG